MNDKQVQRRTGHYPIAQPIRPRSLWGQIWMALFQPAQFFRTLPVIDNNRQWFWAGFIILGLIGLSAVQQASNTASDLNAIQVPVDVVQPPGGFGEDFGGLPDGGVGIPPPGGAAPAASNISSNWTTALIAASGIVLGWFIQTLLLAEVSLLKGFAPRLGRNFQVAVWASLPLGLMAVLQLLYSAAGGTVGGAGLSGLIPELPGYENLPSFFQLALLSLATQLTLFWLWNLALIYVGARRALNGKWWSSLLVVVAWVLVIVLVPILTGTVKLPTEETSLNAEDLGLPPEALDMLPQEFLENMMSGSGNSAGSDAIEVTAEPVDFSIETAPSTEESEAELPAPESKN
jgi:hypothetical protein